MFFLPILHQTKGGLRVLSPKMDIRKAWRGAMRQGEGTHRFFLCSSILQLQSLPGLYMVSACTLGLRGFLFHKDVQVSMKCKLVAPFSSEGLWERGKMLNCPQIPVISQGRCLDLGRWGHWWCRAFYRHLKIDEWVMSIKRLAWKEA